MKTNLLKKIALSFALVIAINFVLNAQDVVKTVEADCFVKRGGTKVESQSPNLVFKHSGETGTNRRIYLRFDISDIDTTKIETAKLSMFLNAGFTNIDTLKLNLYGVSDKYWDENSVVDPGPDFDNTPFADFDITGSVGWKQSSDLTSYLKQSYKDNKSLNLAVFSSGTPYYPSNTLNFDSKEKDGGNPAKLEIVYKAGGTSVLNELKTQNEGVSVYPSFVTDFVNVNIVDDESWNYLSIQNMKGQCVKKLNISGQTGFKIDMAEFPNGIYILGFAGNNKTIMRKIIKR